MYTNFSGSLACYMRRFVSFVSFLVKYKFSFFLLY